MLLKSLDLKPDSPQVHPDLFTLQIRLQAGIGVSSKVCDIQAVYGDPKLLREELQCHFTGQLLEKKEDKNNLQEVLQ